MQPVLTVANTSSPGCVFLSTLVELELAPKQHTIWPMRHPLRHPMRHPMGKTMRHTVGHDQQRGTTASTERIQSTRPYCSKNTRNTCKGARLRLTGKQEIRASVY